MIEIVVIVITVVSLILNIVILLAVLPQASFLLKVGPALQKISYQLDVLIKLHQGRQVRKQAEESGLVDVGTPDLNYDPRFIDPKN